MKPVGVFAATRWECQAVVRAIHVDEVTASPRCLVGHRGACRLLVVETGIGPAHARQAAHHLLNRERVGYMISTGFVGALVPARIGDLFVASEVVGPGYGEESRPTADRGEIQIKDRWVCDDQLVEKVKEIGRAAGLPLTSGPIVTVPRVLCVRSEKQRLAATSDAIGVDMESGALAEVAADHRLPFAVVRAVSDLATEDLPVNFNAFLEGAWLSGIAACLRRPSTLVGLVRLRQQTVRAGERLTALFSALCDAAQREA